MDLNGFTLRIVMLAIPGVIALFLSSRLTGRTPKSGLNRVLLIIVLTVLAYMLHDGLAFVLARIRGQPSPVPLSAALVDIESMKLAAHQLFLVAASAVLLAYLLAYAQRFNVINVVGQAIRATQHYGDEDVWHFFWNAPDDQKNAGWVVVRDHALDLVYYGFVSTWSDSGRDRELILGQVEVFSNVDGRLLYEIEHLYVCREKHALSIEVPKASGYGPDGSSFPTETSPGNAEHDQQAQQRHAQEAH
jgi:hypothetical protein